MIVWKRGRRDASRASTGAKRSEVTDQPNQARLSERIDAGAHREQEGTSCWDRSVAMSRRQLTGDATQVALGTKHPHQTSPCGHALICH